jgi:GTP-binding protein Era
MTGSKHDEDGTEAPRAATSEPLDDPGTDQIDQMYEDALRSIERAISFGEAGKSGELDVLRDDLSQLHEMAAKLKQGRLDIVVFGEVNTGKSSLINALLGEYVNETSMQSGKTTVLRPAAWQGSGYRLRGYGDSYVAIVDTPGICEVDGQARTRLAQNAASSADLILFVAAADLKAPEFDALRELVQARKPLILVMNKADLYTRAQRDELRDAVERRTAGMIDKSDIVWVASDPAPREVEIERADGSFVLAERKPSPDVTALKQRILEVLAREGKGLVAINAALFASDSHDKVAATRMRLREAEADARIWTYAAIKAAAVAVNPVPLADLASAFASDVMMVAHLSTLYGVPFNKRTARDLAVTVTQAAGAIVGVEWLIHITSGALKTLTVGLSTLLTAVPQGVAAGYGSLLIGRATKYYLEHNASWGEEGPKAVVQRILDEMKKNRASLIARLETAIRENIDRNRHARPRG